MTQAVRSAFARLIIPQIVMRCIVVDNASHGTTTRNVGGLTDEARGKVLLYVREDRLGLHNGVMQELERRKASSSFSPMMTATFDSGPPAG